MNNNSGYLPSSEAARLISTTFTDTEVNNCFSIYHTSWITRGPKSTFICENVPAKAILFFFSCSELNSTWLITSELANQRARKILFTCVVYTNLCNWGLVSIRNREGEQDLRCGIWAEGSEGLRSGIWGGRLGVWGAGFWGGGSEVGGLKWGARDGLN